MVTQSPDRNFMNLHHVGTASLVAVRNVSERIRENGAKQTDKEKERRIEIGVGATVNAPMHTTAGGAKGIGTIIARSVGSGMRPIVVVVTRILDGGKS